MSDDTSHEGLQTVLSGTNATLTHSPAGPTPVPLSEPTPLIPDIETPTSEVFEISRVHITAQPPLETAILHIYQDGSDDFRIWGANNIRQFHSTKPIRRPRLALGELAQAEPGKEMRRTNYPGYILWLMDEFSRTTRSLSEWINDLRDRFGNQFNVVLVDFTGFEIPWEMMTVPPTKSCTGGYLGVITSISRWQRVLKEDSDDELTMDIKTETCSGRIIAHINYEELEHANTEVDALKEFDIVEQDSIFTFKEYLARGEEGFGLVYLACHGQYGNDASEIVLSSKNNNIYEEIRLYELYSSSLDLLRHSSSVVFINACHSGRLIDEERLPDGVLRGFAEMFLRKGARGVIGTTGEVNDLFAARFAAYFINEVLREPNIPVAAALRNTRAEIIRSLPAPWSEPDKAKVLFAFMYVFYGNPLMVLQLDRRRG